MKYLLIIMFFMLFSCSTTIRNSEKRFESGYIIPVVGNFQHSYQFASVSFEMLGKYKEEPFKINYQGTKYRMFINVAGMYWFLSFEKTENGGLIKVYQPAGMFFNSINNCFYISDYTYEMNSDEWNEFEKVVLGYGFWEKEIVNDFSNERSYLIEGIKKGKYKAIIVSEEKGINFDQEVYDSLEKSGQLSLPHYFVQTIIKNFYSKKAVIEKYPLWTGTGEEVSTKLCKEKFPLAD